MIDGRRNRRDFSSIVYETYKDFAENTSFHGLKYTVKEDVPKWEKVFWLLVVLAGILGAGYMTVLFWSRYNSNPTRTSVLTAFAPTTAVPFPAITLCNINRIMADQVDEFVRKLSMEEDQVEIVRRAFPQLLSFTDTDSRRYNITELTILQNVLLENNYFNITEVMKKITQPCKGLIQKCMWEYKTVDCSQLFTDSLTTDGFCCSFNYIREYLGAPRRPLYTPFNGFNGGLKLFLDPEIQSQQYSSLHSSGLKVMVHTPWDYPGSGSIYKIVSAGRQSYLQITASKILCSSEIKRLSIQQRQCAYSDEVRLRNFLLYSDTNCLSECEEKYLYERCGCVPFYYPFSRRTVCNITTIPCLDESIGTTLVNVTNACNCPSQCEDIFYTVLSSTTALGQQDTSPTADFADGVNITNNSISLYIYFVGDRQTILYKDIITSTTYLLSSFGGVYSLFLGCSFVSVVEIIYYCTFRLIVNLKLIGRIDKTTLKFNKKEGAKQKEQKVWTYEGSVFLH